MLMNVKQEHMIVTWMQVVTTRLVRTTAPVTLDTPAMAKKATVKVYALLISLTPIGYFGPRRTNRTLAPFFSTKILLK